jgi:biotin carboxylase
MDLTGKKLLILGGGATSIDIVDAAKKMGIYTIVTDWYDVKRSPAKLVADEYWNEEIFKPERIAQLINEHHIDGVLTGFTDSYLLQYQRICELSGLPCYATKEVFELTMDKSRFKQLCRDNDIPVIPEYDLENFDPNIINENHKVIVKPVDNSGSRGVVLCSKPEDFQQCLDYALSFSEKKQVVIEQYMEMDSISLSYTIQDGVVSLSTTDDRYIHKSQSGSSVTQCGIYPSKYTDAYIEKIDSKMKKMYEKAGLKNGVLAVQFFTNGKDFYVMEMGHRLTGGQHYTYTMAENGISSLDQLIHFAVTGSMADFSIAERDNARFKHVYCHLFILGKEAIITRFEGLYYLKQIPEVMHLTQMKKVGDKVGVDGTSAQKVVGLHLKVDDIAHLKRVIDDVKDHFHFYDENGNDLTIIFNKDRI